MTIFLLPSETVTALRAAVARARAKPTPWATLKEGLAPNQDTDTVMLDERAGLPKIEKWIETIILPFNWRVAISCEEQPAGFLLHVSMSSPKRGKVPSPEAMQMLTEALGFDWQTDVARTWLEELDPGHEAVNMLILLEGAAR